jgi:hypothetical protein
MDSPRSHRRAADLEAHGFGPCTACETTKGQYSNSVKNLFDYIRYWTNKRF